jgi:hypothetical protein
VIGVLLQWKKIVQKNVNSQPVEMVKKIYMKLVKIVLKIYEKIVINVVIDSWMRGKIVMFVLKIYETFVFEFVVIDIWIKQRSVIMVNEIIDWIM